MALERFAVIISKNDAYRALFESSFHHWNNVFLCVCFEMFLVFVPCAILGRGSYNLSS